MNPIRVFIVDDHAVLRAGLRMLLSAQPDMVVAGEASSGEEALTRILELNPAVVTLDLSLPGGGGFPVLERLRKECPQVRVLVLTMHDDPAYFRRVLEAGGAGYVVKSAPETEVVAAIRAVHQGRAFFNLSLTSGLVQVMSGKPAALEPNHARDPVSILSQREREVMGLAAQGYTNQQIADQLFLSVKTIETYRARLMAKLHLENRADLVRVASAAGLLGSATLALANLSS
jgi:two-component system response regulator NreC